MEGFFSWTEGYCSSAEAKLLFSSSCLIIWLVIPELDLWLKEDEESDGNSTRSSSSLINGRFPFYSLSVIYE